MMKSDFEEIYSISSVADAPDGMPTHEASSSHKSKDELCSPKTSAKNEASENSLLTKFFSKPSSITGLASFDSKDTKSPTRIKTTSELEEKFHDNNLRERYIKMVNKEIYLKYYVADASHEISREGISSFKTGDKPPALNLPARTEIWETPILEKPSSKSDVEDKYSSTLRNIFSEAKEMYSDSSPSKKQTNFETRSQFSISDASDVILPLVKMPSSCKLKDGTLLENTEYFRSKLLSGIPPDLSSLLSDTFANINTDNASADNSETSSFQELAFNFLAAEYEPSNKCITLLSKRDETTDVLKFTESFSGESVLNRVSSDFQIDNECPELATPCPLYDDSNSSSSSSSLDDYYDDDEDIQLFCLQDMCPLRDQESYNEAFKNENNERPNSIESNASSDRNCGTPCCQFMLKEVESYKGYLLMQVQEYFSENSLADAEIMSRQESISSIITSRYFTDEFAQQHGLTVSENGVDRIGNALENDIDERVKRRSSEPNSYLRRLVKSL